MAQNIPEQVAAKFPNVELIPTKSSSKTKVYKIKTDGSRQALFDRVKTFLKDKNVKEVYNAGLSSRISTLEVQDGSIRYVFVIKPMSSNRASAGIETQQLLGEILTRDFDAKVTSKAGLSSRVQDISFQINGQREGAEIKGVPKLSGMIATFDRSVARPGIGLVSKADDKPIEEVAEALAFGMGLKLNGNGKLAALIDELRKTDTSIGYPGDPGVLGGGGKLPTQYFITSDKQIVEKIIKVITDHFHHGNDNYFIVYERPSQKYVIFDTGLNNSPSIRNTKLGGKHLVPFDSTTIQSAGLAVYGTLGAKGRIRIALYVKISDTTIARHVIRPES